MTRVFEPATDRPRHVRQAVRQGLAQERFRELQATGIPFDGGPNAELKLAELRKMYEPFVNGLAQYFVLELPEFQRRHPKADNWQTSAWMQPTPGLLDLRITERGDHFE